ncbi:MAG: type II secretion system GspH family protein [Lentisphaeraceae bacterium]|nr:type II secretion system GspH family protein [Lentisphaeraceae bacterium]
MCASEKRVFTLIELLVAIAIIGILISLLFPSLSQARVKAKRAVCKAQLNQCGKIMYMYGDDNSHILYGQKSGQFTTARGYDNQYIFQKFRPYSEAILRAWGCPMFDARPEWDSEHTNHLHLPGTSLTYGGEPFSDIRMANQTSRTVLTQDLVYKWSGDWRSNHSAAGPWDVSANVGGYENAPGYVFTKEAQPYGANISYGDGHTEWVSYSSLRSIGNTGGLTLWSTQPE